MYGCTVSGNTAARNGGGAKLTFETSSMSNCVVMLNTAANGGGVHVADGVVYGCQIEENRTSKDGAGVYAMGSVVNSMIESCRIHKNQSGARGGGALLKRGSIRNSLITGNSALHGAGVESSGEGDTRVENCTVSGNSAKHKVGGVYAVASLKNSIVYHNMAPISPNHEDVMQLIFSCTTPDPGGTGNITDPPKFVSAKRNNYRLGKKSPCIDTGTNTAWMTKGRDIDARYRLHDGNGDRVISVDMGAFEFGSAVLNQRN